jgi:hypothetical protein
VSKYRDVQPTVDAVVQTLSGLPGIVGVHPIQQVDMEQIVELENKYELSALAPTKCLGVRIAAERDAAIGVIKDGGFRNAPKPTVYLVEENAGSDSPPEHLLSVEGKRYLIVGEEVFASRLPYLEKTVSMGDSFVIFPNRVNSGVPAFFVVPPLKFPELEANVDQLGIRKVLSVSPSPPADAHLREICGFSPDPSMATLLLAFDLGPAVSPIL